MIKKSKKQKLPMLTKKNWPEQLKKAYDGDTSLLYGYMSCVERELPVLEEIISKSENFEELKSELLKFTMKQQEFIRDVNKKERSNPEKFGL